MSKLKYDGFELEHFDDAHNFREYQIKLIKPFLKGDFLEVGAGKGGLVNFYYKYLKTITLIEPSKNLFKILKQKFKKKKIIIKQKTIKNLKEKFNTIIYFDVLEHIEDDLSEIKNAKKRLKKNGYLVFNVPAYQNFYSAFDKKVGHFRRYEKKDFILFSKKTKLKIVRLCYYDSIGFLFLLINKILRLKHNNLKFKLFIWNILIPLSKIIDFLTYNKFGKSLLCIYKKD
jgi:SAM-dependent methyltransferase